MLNNFLKSVSAAAVISVGLILPATTLMAHQSPNADQAKNDGADRNLMLQIRRDIVRDKTLSTYAHNVKIIAQNGTVTVKGPVRSDTEKKAILDHAEKHAGQGHVVDQITVHSN
jgi:osmotically-inducible protein OsmY